MKDIDAAIQKQSIKDFLKESVDELMKESMMEFLKDCPGDFRKASSGEFLKSSVDELLKRSFGGILRGKTLQIINIFLKESQKEIQDYSLEEFLQIHGIIYIDKSIGIFFFL